MPEQEYDPSEDQGQQEAPPQEMDGADQLAGEVELLKQLEALDIEIDEIESEKAADMKVYNKKLKDLGKARKAHLKDIAAYRLGERGLFENG